MHLTNDDLVLHYYGELGAAEERQVSRHLSECSECRREFTRLQRVLRTVDDSALAPDLPDNFERTVWARLEPNLRPQRRGWFSLILSPAPLALAAVVLVLVGAAFFAGRLSSPGGESAVATKADQQARERILLVDLGEHLDRSQMVLVELVAKDGAVGIRGERAQAEQLLAANRLYRETAAATGETVVSELLDELERVLVEVAAAPDQPSEQELNDVRKQIDANGLLFRVRIVTLKVRDRQREAIEQRAGQRASSGV
jgi:anti-sigma factor RsiW